MASKKKTPLRVDIRSYQVGFGDCFLVSFVYAEADQRHVLIDFGTTGLPHKKKPSEHMPRVAGELKKHIDKTGPLIAVVATHRHADHISGFGTDGRTGKSGEVIRGLKPLLVLQPWTEDPDAQPNATSATTAPGTEKGFLATLRNMNDVAAKALQLADANPKWMSTAALKELSFLGADNIANKSAVENLIAMGKATEKQKNCGPRYLKFGDRSGLEAHLPGVKVHVLGPPDLEQSDAIRSQRSKDQDEFWQLRTNTFSAGDAFAGRAARGKGESVPPEARWFRNRLQNTSATGLLEIVRQLDAQMNNTSLILLFEVNGKKLLFPGDAQLENWSYALSEAKNSADIRKLLAEVDFYKVGHHGSLNATPKKMLWEKFKKRQGKKLETMISTMSGKHGKVSSKTEVPRKTLMTALRDESTLKNTQSLTRANDFFVITTI
jgi:hypothetical protein